MSTCARACVHTHSFGPSHVETKVELMAPIGTKVTSNHAAFVGAIFTSLPLLEAAALGSGLSLRLGHCACVRRRQ